MSHSRVGVGVDAHKRDNWGRTGFERSCVAIEAQSILSSARLRKSRSAGSNPRQIWAEAPFGLHMKRDYGEARRVRFNWACPDGAPRSRQPVKEN
jgi:hypothetical protein